MPEDPETFHLHEGETRTFAGKAVGFLKPDGTASIKMQLLPQYEHLRPHFRARIEDYLGAVRWYRARNFGDRNPHG